MLNRKELLKRANLQIEKVVLDIDGKKEEVFVRQMSGRERDRFEQSILKKITDKKGNVSYEQSLEDFRAKLAVVTVCDEKGNLIFLPNDVEELSQSMSAFNLEIIVNKAQSLNNMSEADREDLLKNSEAAQKGGSTLGSAKN